MQTCHPACCSSFGLFQTFPPSVTKVLDRLFVCDFSFTSMPTLQTLGLQFNVIIYSTSCFVIVLPPCRQVQPLFDSCNNFVLSFKRVAFHSELKFGAGCPIMLDFDSRI